MLQNLPTKLLHPPLPPPPLPPAPHRATHNQTLTANTEEFPGDTESEGSFDRSQQRAKKRITPDAKYQFMGDDVGFVRLKGKKRVIKNKLKNNNQKKWTMSMKRHWNTAQKDKCMAAISIKRSELSSVSYIMFCTANTWCNYVHVLVQLICRRTRDSMRMGCASYSIFSTALMSLRQRTTNLIPRPCLLYTSPSPRDRTRSRMPSSA